MIVSRDLNDLHPKVHHLCQAFLDDCKRQGIDVLVTCTYRDDAAQNELYSHGRTKTHDEQGHRLGIVTNARAGQSAHNYRLAFDCVPLRLGKPVWGTTGADGVLWAKLGASGASVGLEWAGKWPRFREFPHFQYLGGLTIAELQTGHRLP